MERETIRVGANGIAVIECPHCRNAVSRDVGNFKGLKRNVKVKCKCKSAFRVSFEFRKARREGTSLQGFYAKHTDADDWTRMVIISISIAGVRFLTHTAHNLWVGDQLRVRFNLSDEARSLVERDAVVKWVSDENVGCAFTQPIGHDDTYNTALTFIDIP